MQACSGRLDCGSPGQARVSRRVCVRGACWLCRAVDSKAISVRGPGAGSGPRGAVCAGGVARSRHATHGLEVVWRASSAQVEPQGAKLVQLAAGGGWASACLLPGLCEREASRAHLWIQGRARACGSAPAAARPRRHQQRPEPGARRASRHHHGFCTKKVLVLLLL